MPGLRRRVAHVSICRWDRSLFVAGLQSAAFPGDPAATLARFERDVRALRSTFAGLELVVAPELHLMALPPLLEEGGVSERELAVDVPGELTERLGALARETGLWLMPGSVYERVGDGVANTALVLSPAGELVASYRKCFPWQPYETSVPGTSTVVLRHRRRRPVRARDLPRRRVPRDLPVARVAGRGGDLPGDAHRHLRPRRGDGRRARERVREPGRGRERRTPPRRSGTAAAWSSTPRAPVRYEAGVAEEVLTAVLDLDAVARVRERGAFGINRCGRRWTASGRGSSCRCTAGATGRADSA